MGFNNPGVPWGEIERRLSDRSVAEDDGAGLPANRRHGHREEPDPPTKRNPSKRTGGRNRSRRVRNPGDGGDSPAWTHHREPYEAPEALGRAGSPGGGRYAELHCHSAFSFLDGASMPEMLAEEAARLGLEALAITDHHGFYGVVRFAEAARELGLPSVFGAEVTVGAREPRPGPPDPDGRHLVLLARDPTGYAKLAALLSQAQMAGEKGRPQLSFADVAEAASGRARGHWAVLTGCRKGMVPTALDGHGPAAAERELRALVAAFGAENTFVELWDHSTLRATTPFRVWL
jgi:error-prone DNA polymerase